MKSYIKCLSCNHQWFTIGSIGQLICPKCKVSGRFDMSIGSGVPSWWKGGEK